MVIANFNKSKIIATIGPASMSADILEKMIRAGVDVCRINASHGNHVMQQEVVDTVRRLNEEKKFKVAILYDLQGPKMRIGEILNNEIYLEENEFLTLTVNDCIGDKTKIQIRYPYFHNDVHVGDTVLIDDGKIELQVTAKDEKDTVTAKVIHGGVLSSKKGINLPYTKISLPSLTEKDRIDLEFALKNDIEWIGLSFVRSANDIVELKKIIAAAGKNCRVIAKIEKPEAIRDIDNIISASDGIMVARGDLGVEMAMEKVPVMQKMIVRKSTAASKPVIIATQMMESMITSYRPTRAETNDVANAVFDGADALMLSAETSVGAYPLKVIEAMSKIISIAESEEVIYNRHVPPIKDSKTFISDSVCFNSCVMAKQSGAKGIIAMTRSGYTAFKISSQRPNVNIFIFTDNLEILSMLSLVWGVRAFYYNKYESTDNTIRDIKMFLKQKGYLEAGDMVINVFSTPLDEKAMANTIKLNFIS
ncbi:MAG: pyruvate kinase [Bacteroidota bacterium]|nr:pyruvate kinase [Bacteroidota bacterium]